MATTYKRIEAVRKTTEIIEYLSGVKDIVTGPQIAQAVGMSVGTVMCHLATLEDAGYVMMIGGGYRLGMRLAVHWARIRSNLEAEIARRQRELESITVR